MRDGAKAGSPEKPAKPQPSGALLGSKPAPGLYLVATPIGHLDDISLRALKTLGHADLIACEDTRMTAKLLSLLGLPRPALTPYHEHNADRARPGLLARLRQGAVVALVSDAGTPLLSDPGFRLVRDCLAEGLAVTSLPGASALLPALQLSGLPCDRFLFAGFLPAKPTARRAALAQLAATPASLFFYESAPRLVASLGDMLTVLGNREAAVARELTKLHEEVRRGGIADLVDYYTKAGPPKGELVIGVAPPLSDQPVRSETIEEQLRAALASLSARDAAALVAAQTGSPRRQVYALALRIKAGSQ